MREVFKYLATVVVAALLLWWVLRDPGPREIGRALRQAWLPGLALAVVLNLLQNVPRVWRWGALLRPVRAGIRFRPMFGAVIIGYMTTWLVPGRLGELVRPALLAGKENLPLGPSLGSILADRLMDGFTVVLMFTVAVWIDPSQGGAAQSAGVIRNAAIGLLGVVTAVLLLLLVLSAYRQAVEAWLAGRRAVVARIGRSLLSLAHGVEALRRPRLLLVVSLHSLLTWTLIALATWVGLRACQVPLTFQQVLILMPLLVLGVAVPTPGNIGGYQAAMKFGLMSLFGVDAARAAGAGILLHLVITVPLILLGLLLLRIERISWRHLLAAGRQLRDLGAQPAAVPGERPVEDTP